MCFFSPKPFQEFQERRAVKASACKNLYLHTCSLLFSGSMDRQKSQNLSKSHSKPNCGSFTCFFYMFLALSQAQPSQASMKDFDGIFVKDLLKFFHRLGARQEAADAGLVQRDALLVVGLF